MSDPKSTIVIITRPPVHSRIFPSERVSNKDRKFGADGSYYIVYFGDEPVMLTEEVVAAGMKRAADNPEDVPPPARLPFSLWLRKRLGLL